MRPHQWSKNLLIFVPMIMAHAVTDPNAWANALIMLVAFCASASSIYLTNDLVDLEADRRHPRKRRRPLASGALPIPLGTVLAGLLFALGLLAASAVGGTRYRPRLCRGLDELLVLAQEEAARGRLHARRPLHHPRVSPAGSRPGTPASVWLLGFSGFLFLSLALVKRSEEMMAVAQSGGERSAARRGYRSEDVPILQMFGCASTFASSVVLALFVGSTAASANYRSPELLWGIVPLILFWQCRLWLSTARGWMHDDPIVFAMRDWVSWLVAVCVLVVLAAAAYGDLPLLHGAL